MPSTGGLLLVHAHPDDECVSTGGLIARSLAEGRRVDLVTCTGGEEGEIHDPTLDPEEARPRLREIRDAELACSVAALSDVVPLPAVSERGELRLHRLGYRDSGMMGTPSNEDPAAFWNVDLDEATARLVAIVREARPAAIVSYDENGNYGHPDHIQAHRIAVAAYEAAAEVAKLYQVAFNRDTWFAMMLEMQRRGIELPWGMTDDDVAAFQANVAAAAVSGEATEGGGWRAEELNPSNAEALRQVGEQLERGEEPGDFGTPDAEISTRVEVAAWRDQKRRSMDCHRTQRQDMGWLLDLPDDLAAYATDTEYYVLRRWRGHEVTTALREESVFDGL